MTPQEIADHKQQWMSKGAYSVETHSDLADRGKTWCRREVNRESWSFKPWTDVYEHTFFFEDEGDAELFIRQFKAY